jgi:hypothetical protein
MTEEEWLSCSNPIGMLEFLCGQASDRKLRLTACAYCRLLWHLLPDERVRQSLAINERYADGAANEQELREAKTAASKAAFEAQAAWDRVRSAKHAARIAQRMADRAHARGSRGREKEAAERADRVTQDAAEEARKLARKVWSEFGSQNAILAARFAAYTETANRPVVSHCLKGTRQEAESALKVAREQLDDRSVLGDLFGNPFRPIAISPAWLAWHHRTIPRLAQAIYDDRAFDRMPVLADALEEAGCADVEMLGHCRGLEPHFRGCFLLDAILTKK